MKKITILLLLFYVVSGNLTTVFSQDIVSGEIDNSSYSFVPHTPNGDVSQYVNVDLFHGSCNINIPLCVLKSKTLSVPVSLNYIPPRLTTPDVRSAGQVGMGWKVRAGGAITRTVRGTADEKKSDIWPSANYSEMRTPDEDLFSFDFCGHSGTFFYHRGRCYFSNSDIMFVNIVTDSYRNNEIARFIITMIDGTVYTFGYKPYISISHPNDGSKEGNDTWYLSKIESADRSDCFYFRYIKMETAFSTGGFEPWMTTKAAYKEWSPTSKSYSYGNYTKDHKFDRNIVNGVYTKSVSYLEEIQACLDGEAFCSVEFDYSTTKDQYYAELLGRGQNVDKVQKLDRIRLLSSSGEYRTIRCFKHFNFRYIENSDDVLKLLAVEETGIGADLQEKSLPPYQFSYNSIKERDASFEVLHKMTYPTGGFSVFEFGMHTHDMKPYFSCTMKMGLRINKISSYSAEDEEPLTTHYEYINLSNGASSGKLSRTDMTEKAYNFPVGYYGSVDWKQTSNFDLGSSYSHMPSPNVVGYSYVKVTKGDKNDRGAAVMSYEFSNYTSHQLNTSNGQRGAYCQVGQLMQKDDKSIYYRYRYDDQAQQNTINYSYCEYLPFNTHNYGGVYTKKLDLSAKVTRYVNKPKEIMKYYAGDLFEKTTYSYHPDTQQLVREESVNQINGDVYVTEYNYLDFITYVARNEAANAMKEPYEIVKKKNGKVFEATVTRFAQISYSVEYVLLPKKVYRLAVSEPVDDYQYSGHQYGEFEKNIAIDPRCRLEVSYEYNKDSSLKKAERPGREPVYYEWDNCRRLLSKQEGEMKTGYTHGVFGVVSMTAPNGRVHTNEYDILGRLSVTRDEEGNIVHAIDYEHELSY